MKLAIIGAGPAGIFAAQFLKEWNGEIHLFEANAHIGKKLALTGGGRMNLTNKDLNVNHFFSKNERTLKHIFKNNFARNYVSLFEDLGIDMKWEKNRALLKSENGAAQVQQWEHEFQRQKNLTLHLQCEITDIQKLNNKFVLCAKDYKENFDLILITTGGMLRLLKKKNEQEIYSLPKTLRHTVVKPSPCLSPIQILASPFIKLAGTAMKIELSQNNKNKIKDDLLFTHVGISGPAVLDFSAVWDKETFELNFLPEQDENTFTNDFTEQRNGKHKLISFLQKLLPKRVAEFHAEQINGKEKMIADINKEDFKVLKKNLFHWQVKNGNSCGYEQSWTTRGGVSLDEIQAATMESKLVPNLFFAGEVVDVTGLCGGYNITFAAISARIACEEIQEKAA